MAGGIRAIGSAEPLGAGQVRLDAIAYGRLYKSIIKIRRISQAPGRMQVAEFWVGVARDSQISYKWGGYDNALHELVWSYIILNFSRTRCSGGMC